jgi:2-hydroxycyclohexanecarboxyl-CoA dehydrogenase
VTGGSRGLGRQMVLAFAERGAEVIVASRKLENCEKVAAEARELGHRALPFAVHAARWDAIDELIEAAYIEFGHVDILVNNAGWDRMGLFLDTDEDTWDRIIAVNLKAMLYVSKAILPHMVARGAGKVVNVASDAGRVGSSGEAVYSATKGAVIAFSKALAREMARHRITVNVVCPGLTETPLLQSLRDQSPKMEKILEAVTRATPLGRVASPEEIAGAVAFFASPEADFVTGQTLSVSGGLTMC